MLLPDSSPLHSTSTHNPPPLPRLPLKSPPLFWTSGGTAATSASYPPPRHVVIDAASAVPVSRAQGYLYKLCPFKDAKQDQHSLGRWKGWRPNPDVGGITSTARTGGHRRLKMLFDGGGRCHNKKQRCACGVHSFLHLVWWQRA